MIKEQANADTDIAAYGQLWVKSTTPNTLQFTDDSGVDQALASIGKSVALTIVLVGGLFILGLFVYGLMQLDQGNIG